MAVRERSVKLGDETEAGNQRAGSAERKDLMSEWHRTRAGKQSPYAFIRWIKSSTEPLGRWEGAHLQAKYFLKNFTSQCGRLVFKAQES